MYCVSTRRRDKPYFKNMHASELIGALCTDRQTSYLIAYAVSGHSLNSKNRKKILRTPITFFERRLRVFMSKYVIWSVIA